MEWITILQIYNGVVSPILKKISKFIFRKKDIRDLIKQFKYRRYLEGEAEYGVIQIEDVDLLIDFLSSDVVITILEELCKPDSQKTKSELEEDFIQILKTKAPTPQSSDPDYAKIIFQVLVSACRQNLNQGFEQQDSIAIIAHQEISRKEDVARNNGKRKFISWKEFFLRNEPHLLPINKNSQLKRILPPLEKFTEFSPESSEKIMVISAHGGFGKSYTLRQIAYNLEEENPDYIILSVIPGFPDITDALNKEIDPKNKYILLFDDADRYIQELNSLFAYVKNQSTNVKVILTSRTAGLSSIKNKIRSQNCFDIVKEVELNPWKKEDLILLLKEVLDGQPYDKEELVVETYPNPYLIVWIGNAIKGNPKISFENLHRKIIADLEFEAFKLLSPDFSEETGKEFLLDLSLITPFTNTDSQILKILSEKYHLRPESIHNHIERLEENGVLRKIGFSSRFNPDMKGDLYLADYINHLHDLNKLSIIINSWGFWFEEKILKNLESASAYCKTNILKDFFTKWIDDCIKNAKDTPGYFRIKNFEYLSRFCYLIPEESLDLLYTYIETPLPPSEADEVFPSLNELSPDKDHYGAVIHRLIDADYSTQSLLDIIEFVEMKVPKGRYDNNKISYFIGEMVNPLTKSFKQIRETLTILENRIDEQNAQSLLSISIGLDAILQTEHSTSYASAHDKITIVRGQLPLNHSVIETRDHALMIIVRMLQHENTQVREKAIEVCLNIRTGRNEKNLFAERLADERQVIINEIEQLLTHENDYVVLTNIESLLFNWYQWALPGTEGRVEKILKEFPRPMKYVLYRTLFHSGRTTIIFNPAEIPSDEEERSKWFFNESENHITAIYDDEKRIKFSQFLVNDYLFNEYQNTNSIVGFLKEITAYAENSRIHGHWLVEILSYWISRKPDVFFEIRENEDTWNSLLPEIQNSIEYGLCKSDPTYLQVVGNDLLKLPESYDIARISNFIILCINLQTEDQIIDWYQKLIDLDKKDVHKILIQDLPFLSKKLNNYDFLPTLSMKIIQKYKTLDDDILDPIIVFVLHDIGQHEAEIDAAALTSLKQELFEKMINKPIINEDFRHYQTQTIFDFILKDVQDIHSFLIQRRKMRQETPEGYNILPLSDISLLKNINNCSEFDFVLNDLLALLNEKLISKHELYDQIKPVITLQVIDSEKKCIEVFIEKLLENQKIDDAIVLCSFLPFKNEMMMIFFKVLSSAIAANEEEHALEMFNHSYQTHLLPEINGETPSYLVEKEEFVLGLFTLASPGKMKSFLRFILDQINHDKEFYIKEFEEISER